VSTNHAEVAKRDYYSILGVSPDSEDVVVAAAYKALMRKYHPDKNQSADAAKKATEINEAFENLRDPSRRAAYDRKHGFAAEPERDQRYPSNNSSPMTEEAKQTSDKPTQPKGRRWKPWLSQVGVAVLAFALLRLAIVSQREYSEEQNFGEEAAEAGAEAAAAGAEAASISTMPTNTEQPELDSLDLVNEFDSVGLASIGGKQMGSATSLESKSITLNRLGFPRG
jgi:curved DNA-binding protein CbpA